MDTCSISAMKCVESERSISGIDNIENAMTVELEEGQESHTWAARFWAARFEVDNSRLPYPFLPSPELSSPPLSLLVLIMPELPPMAGSIL